MKKLEKKFVMNADKVGNNNFVQLKRSDGVAMYERSDMDKRIKSYEVFIIKTVLKGAALPGGKFVEESYEQYPAKSVFGKTAYDLKTLATAEEKFEELVIRAKNSIESKEVSIKTGKPNKGKRSSNTTKFALPLAKGTKFTMKFLMNVTGITQPILQVLTKNWIAEGVIDIAGIIKSEGRGRPSIEYIVV